METDVSIISNNISKNILSKYIDYKVINDNFNKEDLLKYRKVIFFNILNNLKEDDIKELFSYLKNNNITFINVTNNIELVLYTSYLIVYDNDEIAIEGKTLQVLEEEKLLKRLGIELPFIIELSHLLKDYDLINETYVTKESLVASLWK